MCNSALGMHISRLHTKKTHFKSFHPLPPAHNSCMLCETAFSVRRIVLDNKESQTNF